MDALPLFKNVRINKVEYQVKPTGRISTKPAKHSGHDFNGYPIDREAQSWPQIGLYALSGEFFLYVARRGNSGMVHNGDGRCITMIKLIPANNE